MLEKLLLASILTFSFSLFAEMGWSNSKKELAKTSVPHQEIVTLTQRYKNIEPQVNR
jgi:hypothetical protein